jgi:hypothetical protein
VLSSFETGERDDDDDVDGEQEDVVHLCKAVKGYVCEQIAFN